MSRIGTWITSQMLDLQSKVNFLLFNKLCCLASIKQNFYLVVVEVNAGLHLTINSKNSILIYTWAQCKYFVSLAGGAWSTETNTLNNNIIHFLPATQKIIISVVPSKYYWPTFLSLCTQQTSVGSSRVESIDVQDQVNSDIRMYGSGSTTIKWLCKSYTSG